MDGTRPRCSLRPLAMCLAAALVALAMTTPAARAGETVVDLWPGIAPPPAPVLEDASPPKGKTALAERGVTTVVVTGTAAHGAVLHTATGAAQRGLSVILPVDGMSAEDPYTEAAALWCLVTGPASRGKTTLTTTARITF